MIYNFDKSQLKTIEDYEKAHRDFWNFIADNHLDFKPIITSDIIGNCFACEYAYKELKSSKLHQSRCNFCPINTRYCNQISEYTLFDEWLYAKSQEEMDTIAREIAKAKFTEPKED